MNMKIQPGGRAGFYSVMGMALLCGVGCNKVKKEPTRPNIIYIMSDDHAEQAISCYGHGLNKTPNIDRIAKEGVRFTNACVTNSICAPSRAVILTGKHSHKNGLINNEVIFDGSQTTFPKLLQGAGYETAIVGKWHLKSAPTGFDFWSVLPGQGEYYNPDFIEMGQTKRYDGYVTDLITRFSLDWLEKKHDKNKPFCLMIQHKAPHRNWLPAVKNFNLFDTVDIPLPKTFFDDYATRGVAAREHELEIDKVMRMGYDLKMTKGLGSSEIIDDGWGDGFERMSKEQRDAWDAAYGPKNDAFHRANLKGKDLAKWKFNRYMQDYLSTIASVDESVGQVLDYLEKSGLAENTIVVYTSDQGFYLGEHGWFDKRFMYEESLSTPLVIRYPKGIKPGWVCDELVQNMDFAETILDYAGVDIPKQMQGMSMRPLLEQKKVEWRDAIYYQYFEYPGVHSVKRHYGIRTHRYKLIHFYYDVDEWELYDLEKDPQELNNLFNQKGYDEVITRLKGRLQELRTQYDAPDLKKELGCREKTLDHKGVGAKVKLKNAPSKPYVGKPGILTDGKIKIFDWYWASDYSGFHGFLGDDMDAVIDLGTVKPVKSISALFLAKPTAWVYPPKSVEIAVSTDGVHYKPINEVWEKEHEGFKNASIMEYGVSQSTQNVRYVHIKGNNIKVLPKGCSGAGKKAWLFCQEVVIR